MTRSRFVCLLIPLALAASSARAAIVDAAVSNQSGNFFETLNTSTGAFAAIGTQGPNLLGIGFAPNGMPYGADSAIPANVCTIDPATGNLTTLGSSSNTAEASTVGSNGLIYALSGSVTNAAFYTINPTTLSVTVIHSGPSFGTDGLAVFTAIVRVLAQFLEAKDFSVFRTFRNDSAATA